MSERLDEFKRQLAAWMRYHDIGDLEEMWFDIDDDDECGLKKYSEEDEFAVLLVLPCKLRDVCDHTKPWSELKDQFYRLLSKYDVWFREDGNATWLWDTTNELAAMREYEEHYLNEEPYF